MDAEFRKDVLRVMSHRVRTHSELFGDFTIRRTPREEPCHLRLAARQPESRQTRSRSDHLVVGQAPQRLARDLSEFVHGRDAISTSRAYSCSPMFASTTMALRLSPCS